MKVNAIIPCGGSGSRCGLGFNKLFAKLNDKSVIYTTVSKFADNEKISKIILPVSDSDRPIFEQELRDFTDKIVYCQGGSTRTESVKNALAFAKDCDIITIHDGARPFVTNVIIAESIISAMNYGSGISGYNATDTIVIAKDDYIEQTTNRENVFCVQTPQSFCAKELLSAYDKISEQDTFTDDSGVYQKYVKPCHISVGSPDNKKITFKQDLLSYKNCYIGVGYDTHQLVEGRDLILGGVKIDHSKGLLGHSDADVLTHAIMDAIFGACNERDIGYHFPDTDDRYKGISSIKLLKECMAIIRKKGFEVHNVNAVLLCQKPKLANIIPIMQQTLSKAMQIPPSAISISATTTEELGFVGREEGIATHCNCICYKTNGENND